MGNTALFILADELRPVDNLCDRWAKQAFDWPPRRSNPIYRMIKQAEGAALPTGPEPMDDDVAILDNKVIAKAHPALYEFLEQWYCRGGSIAQKAERMSMSRTQFYERWKCYLSYIRGRLHGEGLNI